MQTMKASAERFEAGKWPDLVWLLDRDGIGKEGRQLGGYREREPRNHWDQPFPVRMEFNWWPNFPSELADDPGLEPWFSDF